MKITIETTQKGGAHEEFRRQVSIVSPYDDHDMDSVINDFIKPLLLAWGFMERTVNDYFGKE